MTLTDGTVLTGPHEYAIDPSTRTQTTYWRDLKRVDIVTETDSHVISPLGGLGSATGDPVADLRAALSDRRLRETERIHVRGRELIVLEGHTRETTRDGKPPSGLIIDHTLRYLVDAQTYAPVRLSTSDTTHFFKGNGRPRDGTFGSSWSTEFLEFERLPYTPANARLLEIHPVGPVTTTSEPAAQIQREADARMRRESAEGHRRALRSQAAARRRERQPPTGMSVPSPDR